LRLNGLLLAFVRNSSLCGYTVPGTDLQVGRLRKRGFLVIQALHDRVRGLLHLRTERASPRRGPKPAIGAHIALGDLRMTVQAGFGDELWHWLLEQGWRELTYRPDRRHYRAVPASCVTELIDASIEERPLVLACAVARASFRPIIGDPSALPSYIVRH